MKHKLIKVPPPISKVNPVERFVAHKEKNKTYLWVYGNRPLTEVSHIEFQPSYSTF
jgi:hypothetical protein